MCPEYGGEAADIFDGIAVKLLSNIGDINLDNCSYYVPETDPKIIKAVEGWKSK